MTKEKILEILRSASPANDDIRPERQPEQKQMPPRQISNIKIAARNIKISHSRINISNGGIFFFLTILALLTAWIFFRSPF